MIPSTRQPARPRRATIHTLGCRLNQSESMLLEEKLRTAGYEVVPFGEAADLAIVHTCTVTREADAKSRKAVRQFVRQCPDAFTAVIGCYAQMGADTLQRIPGVDLVVGNQEKLNVLDYVQPEKAEVPLVVRDRFTRRDFEIPVPAGQEPIARRANLKIQDGCDFMCSFCIIPFARGRARSRSLPNLLEEAESLVRRGARELVLTGVNIGLYDWEDRSVLDVVTALNKLDGLQRIRISSIEPTTIPEKLLEWMADPGHKLVPYLHIPLQSGSDRVLATMRRKYQRQDFLDFLHQAHQTVPKIGIGTDILVGFPGETDEDFADTCAVLEQSPLFYAHVFKYSEREGTASARLEHPVPPPVAAHRSAVLRELSARKTRLFQEHHLGQTLEVLFEHGQDSRWEGYAGNFLRVAARSAEPLRNRLGRVRVEAVVDGMLTGTLVAREETRTTEATLR